MYKREVTVPMANTEPYRRPVPSYHPAPVRRRRRRRRINYRPVLFLVSLCVLLVLSANLAAGIAALSPEKQTPVPPQTAPVLASPDAAESDWRLTLVNPWNPLPEDYTFTVKELSGGHAVDLRCYDNLQAMMDACRDAGLSPLICSSYRPLEKQKELFQNKVQRLMAQGYSESAAETEAAKEIAIPGTSEHQLGLALDIVDVSNQMLDSSQEDTAVQQWLMSHSWEYGFILRYPNDKSAITGIIYEPWHYRYVGKEAAKEIYEQGICLEEYLDNRK